MKRMSSSSENNLGSSVGSCVFCLKPLKDPMTLVCGHNICAACVEEASLFSQAMAALDAKNAAEGEGKKVDSFLACPLCGSKTSKSEIKPNIVLGAVAFCEALIAEADATPEKKLLCGFCKEPATKMCVFCGALCEKHSDFLHVAGPMRSHELKDIEPGKKPDMDWGVGSKSLSKSGHLELPLCFVHKKHCDLVCQKCNTLVCQHCVFVGDHKGHPCIGINELLKDLPSNIAKLAGDIREAVPACKLLLDGYENVQKNAEKNRQEVIDEVNKKFAEYKEVLEKKHKEALAEIDQVYKDFEQTVDDRKKALETLHVKCEDYVTRVAAEDSLPKSLTDRYTLFRMLSELNGTLRVIADTKPPEEDSRICRVSFPQNFPGCSPAKVCRLFRFGFGGRRTVVPINMPHLPETRSFESPILALENTSHDGSAFFDPVRRIIVAVSGQANNCRDVMVTLLTDPTHGETTRHSNIIPYPSHGQYPIFDGSKYAYFCESEGDENDRFGRLDLDTMTFEELARIPGDFEEFNSGCFANGKIYAVNGDNSIKEYDPPTNTWTDFGVNLEHDCRLLADPLDDDIIYELDSGTNGFFQIDVHTHDRTLVSTPPRSFDLGQNGEALVVALPDSSRVLFTSLSDTWYFYSFEERRWSSLDNWSEVSNGTAHLVIIPDGPTALYHVDGESHWTGVNLG